MSRSDARIVAQAQTQAAVLTPFPRGPHNRREYPGRPNPGPADAERGDPLALQAVETIPESPAELRMLFRTGELARPTAGMAPGRVQANLVVLPKDLAFDFLLFCQRNPKPCPLLEVVEAGSSEPSAFAPGADLRTDVPMYRVYEYGELTAEVEDVSEYWRDDMVSFLIGCSFTFESALVAGGVPLYHFEAGTNVPMFITNVQTQPAGAFSGPLVVTMRPVPKGKLVKAVQITSRFPGVHGAPVHVGSPQDIGVSDVHAPDLGDRPCSTTTTCPCSGRAASPRRPSP